MRVFVPTWVAGIESSGPAFETYLEAFEWLSDKVASLPKRTGAPSLAEVDEVDWSEEMVHNYNKMFNKATEGK